MYMDAPVSGREITFEAFAGSAPFESVEAAIVHAIVRGEQPTEMLRQTCTAGATKPVFLSISSRDLAEGILNLKDDPRALADWAGFVLVVTEHITFDRPSEHCDRLLAAVWQLAFGTPVSAAMIRLAETIVSRLPRR